jgi:major membrane immunogen (membrane-anchored lipoprotein)
MDRARKMQSMYGPQQILRDRANALVGCAMKDVVGATSQADIQRAHRAITYAIQLFQAAGYTRAQAIQHVISFADMLAMVE